MRTALLIAGLLCLALGLLWFSQGIGWFPYPAASFMVKQTKWAYFGGGLALVGLILTVSSRRA